MPAGYKLLPAKQVSPEPPPPKQRSSTPPFSVSTSQRKVVPPVPLPPRPPRKSLTGSGSSSSAEKRAQEGGGSSPREREETPRSVSSPSRETLHPPPPPRDLEQMYAQEAELARVSPTARVKPAVRMKTTPVDPPLEEEVPSTTPTTTTIAPTTMVAPSTSPLVSSGSVSTGVNEWGSGKRGSNAGAVGGGAGEVHFHTPPSPSQPKVSPLLLAQDLQSKMQAAAALFSEEDEGVGAALHSSPQIPPALSALFAGLEGEIGEGFLKFQEGSHQQQQQQQQQQIPSSRPHIQQGSGPTTPASEGLSSYTEAPLQSSPTSLPPPQILTTDALTASDDSTGTSEGGDASGDPNASPLETPKPTLVLPNAEKVAKKAVKAVVAVAMAPGGCCFGWEKKSPLIKQPTVPAGSGKKKVDAASNDTTNPFSFKALRLGKSAKREDGGKVGGEVVEKNGLVVIEAPVPLALSAEEEGRVV
jgi:hypothetical protein